MSLENEIVKLTKAVEAATKAFNAFNSASTNISVTEEPKEKEEEEEEKPADKKSTKKSTTAKKPAAKKSAKKPAKADDSDKGEELIDKVRESLKNVVAAKDRKAASDILSEYGGVAKLTDLEEEDYENVILACDNLLAEDEEEDEDY